MNDKTNDNINDNVNKKKKIINKIFIASIISVVIFGAAFAYFAFDYFLWWRDGQAAAASTQETLEVFAEQMQDISEVVTAAVTTTHSRIMMPPPDFDHVAEHVAVIEMPTVLSAAPLLRERERLDNPDIVAFMFIEGTSVNNVVVQGPDNSFYLYRDAARRSNVNGALFLDYRNSRLFDDKNTIIYGHNMNNGTMFHNLRYYMREDFFRAHPYITVVMEHQVLIYEIFSVFQTNVDFDYIQVDFGSTEEFGALVDEITRRRAYNTGITATTDDSMLILSTCTNVTNDTRIVVAARLSTIVLLVDDDNNTDG